MITRDQIIRLALEKRAASFNDEDARPAWEAKPTQISVGTDSKSGWPGSTEHIDTNPDARQTAAGDRVGKQQQAAYMQSAVRKLGFAGDARDAGASRKHVNGVLNDIALPNGKFNRAKLMSKYKLTPEEVNNLRPSILAGVNTTEEDAASLAEQEHRPKSMVSDMYQRYVGQYLDTQEQSDTVKRGPVSALIQKYIPRERALERQGASWADAGASARGILGNASKDPNAPTLEGKALTSYVNSRRRNWRDQSFDAAEAKQHLDEANKYQQVWNNTAFLSSFLVPGATTALLGSGGKIALGGAELAQAIRGANAVTRVPGANLLARGIVGATGNVGRGIHLLNKTNNTVQGLTGAGGIAARAGARSTGYTGYYSLQDAVNPAAPKTTGIGFMTNALSNALNIPGGPLKAVGERLAGGRSPVKAVASAFLNHPATHYIENQIIKRMADTGVYTAGAMLQQRQDALAAAGPRKTNGV